MYNVMHLPGVIEIGVTGENQFRRLEFDMRPWLEVLPNGIGSIVHIRPGETGDDAYVAATTMEDGILTWELTAGDVGEVEGYGQMEIWLEDPNTARGKSTKCQTYVRSSLALTHEIPEAQEAWLEQMTGLKTETVIAAQSAEDAKEAAESAQAAAEAARDAAQAVAGDFQGLSATASGLAAGTSPTVNVTHDEGGLFNLAFGIPKGDKGDQGDPPTDSQVQTAANNYLSQVITNPDSPPLDRALSSNAAAAPADMVGDLKSAINDVVIALPLGTGINGKFVNGSSGQLADNKWYITSDLIDVSRYAGKKININSYFSGSIGIAFYAANGTTFVSGVTGTEIEYTGQKKILQLVPSNAVYLRICEYTYTGLGLADCSVVIPTKVETDILVDNDSAIEEDIENIKEDVENLQLSPVNLGYKPTLTEKAGYYVGPTGYSTASNFYAFEPVTIPAIIKTINISCSFYGNSGVAFFNAAGEVLLSVNGNNASTYGLANKAAIQKFTINVPNGAKTFGGSIYNTVYTSVADFAVSMSSKTVEILDVINRYYKLTDTLVSKWFTGKKIVTQGDSLTANGHTASNETNTGYWQAILHDILGATIVNVGIGGTTVYNDGTSSTQNGYNVTNSWMCSTERVNMIPTDANMVIFWGGHNDWGKSVPIGTVGQATPDDQTFVGGLQIALTKMIARVPKAVIVFVTPHVSRPSTNANSNVMAKNSINLTMLDYAKAVKEFCSYYGFPCIDMSDSGISVLNHTKYCSDIIHVNSTDGAKAVASAILNGLVRYMPIVH